VSHKPAPKAVERTDDSHTIRAIRPPFRYADDSSHSLATVETREVTVCLTSSAVVKPESKIKAINFLK
jgi:spore coat protein U-like protein